MPTAAKLVAAICLACLAYLLSLIVMPLMPDSTDFGAFVPVNIVLGLLAGWFVLGSRAGRGITAGINAGLTGVFILILWGVFVQACNEMMRLAMRKRFDGPFEAIVSVFEIGAEYAWTISTVEFGLAALAGAVISGLLTEYAARNWR